MKHGQSGFSLVEAAIVLVIVGLLLGSILKGQELINSSRVRSLGELTTGVQTAYFGFVDRYRSVPGDMSVARARDAIGAPVINKGGNDNGRLGPVAGNDWVEPLALWEHISQAGFIQEGDYDSGGAAAANQATYEDGNAPTNPFNGVIVLGRTDDYSGSTSVRLNLALGRNVPVAIARELDVKLDDGLPDTGTLRFAVPEGTGALFGSIAEGDATCRDGSTPPNWNIAGDSQDCALVYLY